MLARDEDVEHGEGGRDEARPPMERLKEGVSAVTQDAGTASSGNAILEALEARHSMPRMQEVLPPRELVARVLQAAAWAPNHHRTEPWRFFVLAGRAREELGQVFAQSLRSRMQDPEATESQAALAKERQKPLRAPVVVVVATVPSTNPKAEEIEDIAATAAAVQNVLLAAESVGLGAMWRTGAPAGDPAVKHHLGLPDAATIVAFVYLGYPDVPVLRQKQRRVDQYTAWLGWHADTE